MSDPNEPRPIRVLVFPDRPDAILIYVPEGQELWLPRLRTPFDRYDVANVLGGADIPSSVGESVPGRWTHSMKKLASDDRATRGQQQREREAARHVEIQDNPNATTYQQKRAALVLSKEKIDGELRDLKLQLGTARARAATSGQYLPVDEYRTKERRLTDLQNMSLAIQARLGKLRKQENAEKDAAQPDRMQRFVELVAATMTKEKFSALWAKVDEMDKGSKHD